MLQSRLNRLALASLLWVIFWPVFWFFRIGDITGPKAWFWIIGELNYPAAALFYFLADELISRFTSKSSMIFVLAVGIVALIMPFYYQRVGFAFGVLAEAFLF